MGKRRKKMRRLGVRMPLLVLAAFLATFMVACSQEETSPTGPQGETGEKTGPQVSGDKPEYCGDREVIYHHDTVTIFRDTAERVIEKEAATDNTINGLNSSYLEQAAILTHHLQLQNTKFGKTYKKTGDLLTDNWIGILSKTSTISTDMVNDPSAAYISHLFGEVFNAPFKAITRPKFTFIDLFAGIGGFRMALQNLGGECVFSSEWDEQAQRTYYANYGEVPFGDITKESTKNYIPDNFDILCAGFPCQAFSLAGKKLGFAETRGTLFFDVAEILRRKQPKAIFLENVKGLAIHDKGKTLVLASHNTGNVSTSLVSVRIWVYQRRILFIQTRKK